jgi:uncharacterized membrane protein YhaH (DUF805 family)
LPSQENPAQDRADDGGEGPSGRASRRAWATLALALTPAILAIWLSPTFLTQDGPAHLYNAHILAGSLRGDSPFGDVFLVRWSPLPNWLGHVLGMVLVATVTPRTADRLLTTIPLVGLAASTFWLRRTVATRRDDPASALYSAVLGLNVAWLFGFTSFLLGGCVFALTLGTWWSCRDRRGVWPALGIAVWVVVGYFAHVVSLVLTVVGLIVLAIASPGPKRQRARTLAIGLSPMLVLGPLYRSIMRRGGPLEPSWGQLTSIREQLGWVDPISLGRKGMVPFLPGESAWLGVASPIGLLIAALAILVVASARRHDPERRGWAILAALLVVGGMIAPDTLGASHGNYLPQRVVLLGLMVLAPAIDFDARGRAAAVATWLLIAALIGQTLSVWDYARESDHRAGPIARCVGVVGHDRRIGTLLIGIRGRFRANPVLHADNLLGVGTRNVVWSDYETAHYYFPVQFRDDRPHPPASVFEDVAMKDDPADAEARARLWSELLDAHHHEIDILLIWGSDAALESINGRYFADAPFHTDGEVRLFHHR